ncbi:Transposon Tf2-7 polyprotein [Trametes pubescens]|uniref:RNA-directed DNA polymerase n=1 Tax=Trametes pubescens TaxID=154538 RepID=A0A1M2V8X3_TRAPU|nr:Transposon Tf2-7 polyprotein [Trametes pubescens]
MSGSREPAEIRPGGKFCPVLCEGKITPTVVNAWNLACTAYFRKREIPANKQVMKAAGMVGNEILRDWYLNDIDRYNEMSWKDFLVLVRARFLPKGWATSLRSQLIGTRQTVDQPFEDFVFEIEHLNTRLRDTTIQYNDEGLQSIISANIVEDLRLVCEEPEVAALAAYVDWKAALTSADTCRLRVIAMVNRVVTKTKIVSSSAPSKPVGARSSSSTSKSLPRLTDDEKRLLNEYDGCYKCRHYYAGHMSGACPNGYPDAASYVPLSAKTALAAKVLRDAKGMRPRTVAAVSGDLNSGEDYGDSAVASISVSSPLAATTGILGTGSDSEECVTPLFHKHTLLPATILSPLVESPVYQMLIDSGSPTVLIREDVARSLKLKLRDLPHPYTLGNAWGTEQQESRSWVKLRVAVNGFSWSSVSCRAIVVSSLCAPVILGKPFLVANHIVEDHHSNCLIDARTSTDLLCHTPPTPPVPPPSVIEHRVAAAELIVAADDAPLTDHHRFLREMHAKTRVHRHACDNNPASSSPTTNIAPITAAVRECVERLVHADTLVKANTAMKLTFADLFPDDIPPLNQLPDDVHHRFLLKDPNMRIARRQYDCPKKYREVWKQLLEQHIAAGRIKASDSPYASPAFLIPKSDPTAAPRWVNDYRALNDNTVPDAFPLPLISDILADCAHGRIFAKIDMTNAYFQTKVHPDDVKYMAVTTPFGLYKWLVMPQGCRIAPATHQHCMYSALRPFIGTICHVYLDDIVIWSQTVEEHKRNITTVLEALRAAHLYCSDKKTDLFLTELDFLGHHISAAGVQPDARKVEKILNWPIPRRASHVRAFLGLVRYVASFLPKLAEHTVVLTPLTTKDADLMFPKWSSAHQVAFDAIKVLVVSSECLTVIDHNDLERNKIYVSCDASDLRTGAMLSFGPSLEEARPVAFDSLQLKAAELNYPVHEKELLAIVRALKKWRVELLGVPFTVFTDHRTLENFHRQKDLSRRQARWQEFLSQYDFKIKYIKGEENIAADVLSRADLDIVDVTSCAAIAVIREATRGLCNRSDEPVHCAATSGALRVATDPEWLQAIRVGYTKDTWCMRLCESVGTLGVRETDGLLYVGDCLVIPRVAKLREGIFRCAHDSLGHFGFEKSYGSLRGSYYWPNMRKELEEIYIPSCDDCQRNKSTTRRPTGPLHPLPIPQQRGDAIAIDFVGELPDDGGLNCIATVTDRLGSDIRLIPTRTDITGDQFAVLFFDHWYCENGLPLEIVSDRDKLFVSAFWRALHKLTGVKLKMSSSYHPQTDGSSERTNKTVIQALRYHVARNQTGWARALPRVRFAIMNTVNSSTGFTPFQLHIGRSPRVVPPFSSTMLTGFGNNFAIKDAEALIRQIETDSLEAQDNLLLAKLAQAQAANRSRGPDHSFSVGERVLLSTFHCRRDYMQRGDHRVAKFMVRYDGPYTILHAHPDTSVYTLDLPPAMKIFPTFHSSLLKPFRPNDDERYPSRAHPRPGPIITEDGVEEYTVESILDRRRRGRGWQYLVRWAGYGPEEDRWLAGTDSVAGSGPVRSFDPKRKDQGPGPGQDRSRAKRTGPGPRSLKDRLGLQS